MVEYSKNTEVLKSFWKKVENQFKELFNITLEQLLNEENLLNKRLFYQI